MAEHRDFPPPTAGYVLRTSVLEGMDIKQGVLAKAFGVSRFTINQILNDRRGVAPEWRLILAMCFGTSAEMWLKLQANVDLFWASQKMATDLGKLEPLREPDAGASLVMSGAN